ncbi:hypothetical protein [Sphingomonas sp. Leaf10]|uniref:hypothetical protein n=1 Tax=Sphingomonas sp. Leaf10 TaxID=1735676 RepID=UPI000A5092B1|nr:hypothetical protein [Sphingomonas sp. Leaf10]
MSEGDEVTVVQHPNWTAEYMRLAKSGRVGRIERIFTPLGGEGSPPVVRVVFPKVAPYRKERVEFFAPNDLQLKDPRP